MMRRCTGFRPSSSAGIAREQHPRILATYGGEYSDPKLERMVAKARWMLSKAYRDMVQHHIDEMKKACKFGMLTYEPPVVPEKPAVYTQPDSGYLVMSKEQMQRIASLVVPETLMPSEETAEQIRRDDIHLHSCHDCPHWQWTDKTDNNNKHQ